MPAKKKAKATKKAVPKKKKAAKITAKKAAPKVAPKAAPEQKNLKVVDEAFAALNAHDIDKVIACYADDFTVIDTALGRYISGDKAALREYEGMWIKAFPDAFCEITNRFASGDWVVVEFTGRGTHNGELPGIPPTGKKVELPFVSVHKVKGGKIQSVKHYYDSATMFRQLGISPPQGTQPTS